MLAGSPPSAIATGIVSPRSAITRQCAAPTLWRCQCIASSFLPRTWTRYIPTFLTPDSGCLVMTPPSVMYGPPSSGQQIGAGNCVRSMSKSLRTVSWHAARPTVLGGNFATSARRGSSASLPSSPSGTLRASSSAMRAPTWSRQSTPRASDMRRSEPNRLTATGWRDFAPPRSVGCVNSSAGPPPADFMQRSAISVISLSIDTGRSTRTRSPASSIARTNSRRLASAIVDGANAAGEAFEPDARKAGGAEPLQQRFRLREREHRLWQVGIGLSMFRHQSPDGGENAPEVEEIHGAQRRKAGRGELENDEPRPRLQDPGRLAQPAIEVGEVAYAKSHQRAVEPRRGERQRQRIGGDRHGAGSFVPPSRQHRDGEIGADHPAAEAVAARQLRGKVQGAGAEVEVRTVGFRFPAEPRDGGAAPRPVHVETEQMIEEIVSRGDRCEHTAHIRRRAGGGATHRRER